MIKQEKDDLIRLMRVVKKNVNAGSFNKDDYVKLLDTVIILIKEIK